MSDNNYSFDFPVEAGQVLAFSRAIGEPSLQQLAPLTFIMATDHFDPQFPRRPKPSENWLGEPIESLFHAEQSIEYFTHLEPGMQLIATRKNGRRWEKQGEHAGRLSFIETLTELRSLQGEILQRSSWVDVKTERSHASLTQRQVDNKGRKPLPPYGGEQGAAQVDEISRTQLAMYVGAAGDFHPLHHDESYATAQGYPSIFAPGMLTMALNGRAFTHRVKQQDIRHFSGRFKAQVWPGDRLSTFVSVSSKENSILTATTLNQCGEIVFEGKIKMA